jgi:glutaredoxin-like protein NrdH
MRRTSAPHPNSHPDLHESFATHGSVHTTGGRVLPGWRTAVADRATQESRLADPTGWQRHVAFTPLGSAVAGARAYASKTGLADPHTIDYSKIRQDPDTVRTVGRHYDSLPNLDPTSIPHYDAMRREVNNQFDHLTNTMGVHVQATDHDPYSDVHEMVHDVANNKTLKVLGTHATGSHPFFSDVENDKFRAVHDFFGHAATGRSFDRHGEQAAYLAHAQMFSPHALPALASETKGQNTSLILNGHFGPQKMATMDPQHYWHDLSNVTRSARKKLAMNPVTLYTKPGCPQCEMTAKRLQAHGIPHQIVDLTTDPVAYHHVTGNLGYASAPVVDAGNGNHWFGFRPDRIKALLG